eukprot:4659100-Prymnesium_polylepis.1
MVGVTMKANGNGCDDDSGGDLGDDSADDSADDEGTDHGDDWFEDERVSTGGALRPSPPASSECARAAGWPSDRATSPARSSRRSAV